MHKKGNSLCNAFAWMGHYYVSYADQKHRADAAAAALSTGSQLPLPNTTHKGNVHHQPRYHTRQNLVLIATSEGNGTSALNSKADRRRAAPLPERNQRHSRRQWEARKRIYQSMRTQAQPPYFTHEEQLLHACSCMQVMLFL